MDQLEVGNRSVNHAVTHLNRKVLRIPDYLSDTSNVFDNETIRSVARRLQGGKESIEQVIRSEVQDLLFKSTEDLTKQIEALAPRLSHERSIREAINARIGAPWREIPIREFHSTAQALVALAAKHDQGRAQNLQHLSKAIYAGDRVRQGVTTLLLSPTGVGMFTATNLVLSGFGALNGTDRDGTETLKAIQEMMAYLKVQFAIVNSKLDYIIEAVDGLGTQINKIAVVVEHLVDIANKIRSQGDQILDELHQYRGEQTRNTINWELAPCDVLTSDDSPTAIEVKSCLLKYLLAAEHALLPPLVIQSRTPDLEERLLAKLASDDPETFDSTAYSTYAGLISHTVGRALKEPATENSTNAVDYGLLARASSRLSVMLELQPTAQHAIEGWDSRIGRLRTAALQAETSLIGLAGGPNADAKSRILRLVDEMYKPRIDAVSSIVEKYRKDAVTQFLKDSISRGWSENVSKGAEFALNASPSLPGLQPCSGDKKLQWHMDHVKRLFPKVVAASPNFLVPPSELQGSPVGRLRICFVDLPKPIVRFSLRVELDGELLAYEPEIRWIGATQGKSGATPYCRNVTDCFEKGIALDGFYGSVAKVLQKTEERLRSEITKEITWSPSPKIRDSFGRYFVEFLRETDLSNGGKRLDVIANELRKVDAAIGALKGYLALVFPRVWLMENNLQLLLNGKPSVSVIGSMAVKEMIECGSKASCEPSRKQFYSADHPYWWPADGTASSGLERLRSLATEQTELLRRLVRDGVDWGRDPNFYDPYLFLSIARLQGIGQSASFTPAQRGR